jgi:hypothetical protein
MLVTILSIAIALATRLPSVDLVLLFILFLAFDISRLTTDLNFRNTQSLIGAIGGKCGFEPVSTGTP